MSNETISVGISSCLLGTSVRYDGAHTAGMKIWAAQQLDAVAHEDL